MADTNATLTPPTAVPGDTLVVEFDSEVDEFRNALDVEVRISEIDDASPLEPRGESALLVQFFGKLVNNQFESTKAAKLPDAKGAKHSISIEVGDTTSVVPLLGQDGEQGTFELRLQVRWKNPNKATFDQPRDATVVVRAFEHMPSTGATLPVITFVTSAESSAFFHGAAKFWEKHSDAILRRDGMSLEEVLQVLDAEGKKFGTWGQVNIVTHGNPFQLLMKAHAGSPAAVMHEDLIDEEVNALPGGLTKPASVTGETEIIFRACNSGQNADLVSKIKQKFFPTAKFVRVPRWIQSYISTGAFQALTEELRVFRPTLAAARAAMPAALEQDFDRIKDFSPGLESGASFDDELPAFKEEKVLRLKFDFRFSVMESETHSKKDAAIVTGFRGDWVDRHKLDQVSMTQRTTHGEWDIDLASKRDVTADVDASFSGVFFECSAGTPAVQQFGVGSIQVGTAALWPIVGTGIEAEHAQLSVTAGDTDHVTVEHMATAGDTTVKKGSKTTVLTPSSAAFTVSLPVKVTIGGATVEIRAGKVQLLHFHGERVYLSKRRTMRGFEAGKAYEKRNRTSIVESDDDQFHTAF